MSVFLLQDRYLKLCEGEEIPSYPTEVEMKITFAPLDAFGIEGEVHRTSFAVGKEYKFAVDKNDGTVEYQEAMLEALAGTFDSDSFRFRIEGNNLHIKYSPNSRDEMLQNATSANHILPALFSLRMQQYIWIKAFVIYSKFGLYHLFVSRIRPPATPTTEAKQVEHIEKASSTWLEITSGQERYVFASYYYRQAIRLSRLEPAPQTMVPEAILNLSKALEILFHDANDTDKFKDKALQAGLEEGFVEKKLKPILILRNKFGSAHIMHSPLKLEQKDTVQKFMISAFHNVQYCIEFLWQKAKDGQYTFDPISTEVSNQQQAILERIESYLEEPDKEPL